MKNLLLRQLRWVFSHYSELYKWWKELCLAVCFSALLFLRVYSFILLLMCMLLYNMKGNYLAISSKLIQVCLLLCYWKKNDGSLLFRLFCDYCCCSGLAFLQDICSGLVWGCRYECRPLYLMDNRTSTCFLCNF